MVTPNSKIMYGTAMIGYGVQGTIGDTTTYRLRHGNGHYGATLNRLYQDKFTRVVPTSINNAPGEPYRANFRAAVDYWQKILSTAEKAAYNRLAAKLQYLSGYNLFLQRTLRGEIEMFVDRGDPAAYDFDKEDLTTNGTWQNLDISNIVPATARVVLLKTRLKSANPGDQIRYRKDGNTNEINACSCELLRANISRVRLGIVAVTSTQVIEYNADNIAWTELDIVIRGWWT